MKRIGKLFIMLLTVLLVTGCVKESISMNIKSNGNVELSIIMAFAESMSEDMTITDEDKKEFADKGFKVEEYVEDDMKGIKATKTFKLADISTDKEVVVSLDEYLNDPKSDIKFFQKVGKNKYKANFTIDTRSEDYDSETASLYDSNIDISYSVTLPSKAISHNATKVEGNTLTWKVKFNTLTNINYEFSMGRNNTLLIIAGIIGVAIVAIVIVVVVMTRKNKNNSNGIPMTDMPTGMPQQPTGMVEQPIMNPEVSQNVPMVEQPSVGISVSEPVVEQPKVDVLVTESASIPVVEESAVQAPVDAFQTVSEPVENTVTTESAISNETEENKDLQ